MRKTSQLVLFSIILILSEYGLALAKSNLRTQSENSQVNQAYCAYFYEECNYSGQATKICGDIADLSTSSSWASLSTPRSFKLSTTSKIEFYISKDYQGMYLSYIDDQACISDNVIQELRSLRFIKNGEIILYSQCHFQGESYQFTGRSLDLGTWKNKTKSIKIPNGYYVLAYNKTDFQGTAFMMHEGMDCLENYYSKAFIYSIDMVKDTDVAVFSSKNFKGVSVKKWNLGSASSKEDSSFKSEDGESFSIMSFVIPDGKILKTYSEANFKGTETIYTQDMENLGSDQYQYINSYIVESSPYCVTVYDECNFVGNEAKICGKSRWIGYEFAKSLKSIKVPVGTNITLFSQMKYQGVKNSFVHDISCLDATLWDQPFVQSVNIEKRVCPRVYSQCDFKGESIEVCSPAAELKNADGSAFQGRSVEVQAGDQITLYAAINNKAEITTISQSLSCIYDLD